MKYLAWCLALCLALINTSASALTFVVDSVDVTPDLVNGDGECADSSGNCTLPAAIEETNAIFGPDEVNFLIPGTGRRTIYLEPAGLPFIFEDLVINGATQPGTILGDPKNNIPHVLNIEIQGGETEEDCLFAVAPNVVIRGLRIVGCQGFPGYGIAVAGNNALIEDNEVLDSNFGIRVGDDAGVVRGNWIDETIIDGIHAIAATNLEVYENAVIGGDEDGIFIGASYGVTVRDNWVPGNGVQNDRGIWSGISILGGGDYFIENNFFGTDHLGLVAFPNHWGIRLEGEIQNVLVQGNLSSGNDYLGLYIGPEVSGAHVEGNNFGYASDEVTPLCNNYCQEQIVDEGVDTVFVNNLIYEEPPAPTPTPQAPAGCCQISGLEEGSCIDGEITFGSTTSLEACQNLLDEHLPGTGAVATHFSLGLTCEDTGNGAVQGLCRKISQCDDTPLQGCREGEKSRLILREGAVPRKNRLIAKIVKTNDTPLADLGDPCNDTAYTVCAYQGDVLVLEAMISPGGECNEKPCWREFGVGFRFRDQGAPDGIKTLVAKSKNDRGSFVLKGKGEALVFSPFFNPDAATTLQIKNDLPGGECWEVHN